MVRHKLRSAQREKLISKKSGFRPVWKGNISFGLVNIPVTLHSAEAPDSMNFHLLDRRDFSPIRYKRVNEKTGKEVPWSEIIKGYKYEEQYVALTEQDFLSANVEATQSIEIVDFVDAAEISPIYYDKPYYLEPLKNGRHAYALLREVMAKTKKVGIAKIVIRTRQYLAALITQGPLLIINLLRFPKELRDSAQLDVPALSSQHREISDREVMMAKRLIETMLGKWNPEKYRDDYREDLLKLINRKIKSGQTKEIQSADKMPQPKRQAKVIDIMHLLQRSVNQPKKNKKAATSA
jgi:DNA end-binding protein Ku